MRYLYLKDFPDLMVLRFSNNFGDQIIKIVDITQEREPHYDLCDLYAGKLIQEFIFPEGQHESFTEKNILRLMKNEVVL